ncbi:cytidine deaminase-like protein [Kockovaella imperatae]|uniref:Deoxycytidylate deaminase n=1 Tax=Kockovaella imperatae TaxID=4999 RepID=A0A1Y1UNV5_9TREE|nr:cytidine deaminase-like protein [Kockovaella imperatae]ORX39721.1 cytidine deaminase-like protein [Kockovaella imperatae]
MFIAIAGTPSSGKRTLLEYLVNRYGFTQVGLDKKGEVGPTDSDSSAHLEVPLSSLSVSTSSTPAVTTIATLPNPPLLPSTATLLDYTTRNWLSHHVTLDLTSYETIEPFVKRPFFLLVFLDGPLRARYERERHRRKDITLDEFCAEHDVLLNAPEADFRRVVKAATLSICNNAPTIAEFYKHLDQMDLLNEERLRPGWDNYFMTLASLASHRSNCMKRRVGALLVRSKRILSTGYNGTPRGTRNCNQGGCRRCNGSARGGEALDECLCLHAEENALLEAGRERIGEDSVLYCNTCPCLRCSVKIVQTGVREVVYNQSYSMDAASAMVLREGGVTLRQLLI